MFTRIGMKKLRSERATTIIEFGPALFIVLFLFFFPMINLFGLGISYCDCLYLNKLVLRRAATESDLLVVDSSSSPSTVKVNDNPLTLNADIAQVVSQWSSGFGKFTSTAVNPAVTTQIDQTASTQTQYPGQTTQWPVTWYVNVDLRCERAPLLPLPLFFGVPGLSAPVVFEFKGRTMIENIPHPV